MKENTLTFEVELNMFKQGAIRKVEVPVSCLASTALRMPTAWINLEQIFIWGQNDVQAMELPSVSMGDVIRYKGDRYLIQEKSFKKLKEGDITVGFISS